MIIVRSKVFPEIGVQTIIEVIYELIWPLRLFPHNICVLSLLANHRHNKILVLM